MELHIRRGPQVLGPFRLEDGPNVAGRAEDCDILLPSRRVSRHHCVFELFGGRVTVRDLGSHNGVVGADGRRVSTLTMVPGDEVLIGDYYMGLSELTGATELDLEFDHAGDDDAADDILLGPEEERDHTDRLPPRVRPMPLPRQTQPLPDLATVTRRSPFPEHQVERLVLPDLAEAGMDDLSVGMHLVTEDTPDPYSPQSTPSVPLFPPSVSAAPAPMAAAPAGQSMAPFTKASPDPTRSMPPPEPSFGESLPPKSPPPSTARPTLAPRSEAVGADPVGVWPKSPRTGRRFPGPDVGRETLAPAPVAVVPPPVGAAPAPSPVPAAAARPAATPAPSPVAPPASTVTAAPPPAASPPVAAVPPPRSTPPELPVSVAPAADSHTGSAARLAAPVPPAAAAAPAPAPPVPAVPAPAQIARSPVVPTPVAPVAPASPIATQSAPVRPAPPAAVVPAVSSPEKVAPAPQMRPAPLLTSSRRVSTVPLVVAGVFVALLGLAGELWGLSRVDASGGALAAEVSGEEARVFAGGTAFGVQVTHYGADGSPLEKDQPLDEALRLDAQDHGVAYAQGGARAVAVVRDGAGKVQGFVAVDGPASRMNADTSLLRPLAVVQAGLGLLVVVAAAMLSSRRF